MMGVGEAYQEMGEILETIETVATTDETVATGEAPFNLTTTQPETSEYFDNEQLSVRFGLQFSFLRSHTVNDTVTITPCDIEFADDRSLHVEFKVTVDQNNTRTDDHPCVEGDAETESNSEDCDEGEPAPTEPDRPPASHSESGSTKKRRAVAEPKKPEEPDDTDAASPTTNSDGHNSPTLTTASSEPHDGRRTDADTNDGTSATPSSDVDTGTADTHSSRPPYRDPDRLAEVYEEQDTFGDMTDALGVDVTPQTVRRYMIKYDIHKPASNTGSQTAETLLDLDPDSISTGTADSTQENANQNQANGASSSAAVQESDTDAPVATDGKGAATEQDETTPMESQSRSVDVDVRSEMTDDSTMDDTEVDAMATEAAPPDDTGAEETGETQVAVVNDTSSAETERGEQSEPTNNPDFTATLNADAEVDVDLPDHLTLDDITATVQDAQTLYEAQQRLDLDREQTRELLQELNLLDLVHGRAATRDFVSRTIEDINQRLQSTTGPQSD